ncbi:MAG: hypothetical protein CMI60_03915 [Parvibaculum sp.]|jgi:hypothetical protein|nr:hypothetical protein [Parvibaculum sp.]|tara:strand:+ start:61 stop:303 length:243 start_codon:yes stop_codon:yes gene_type:complete
MDVSPLLFWNVLLTLVVAPLMYNIRTNANEIKRVNILLNKTREEIPTLYVTKSQQQMDIARVLEVLDKMEQKIDKLFEVK